MSSRGPRLRRTPDGASCNRTIWVSARQPAKVCCVGGPEASRVPLPVLGREVPRFATSSHQLIDWLTIQLQPPRRVGRANTALAREAKLWLAFSTPPAIRLPTPLCRAPWPGAGWLIPETPAFR